MDNGMDISINIDIDYVVYIDANINMFIKVHIDNDIDPSIYINFDSMFTITLKLTMLFIYLYQSLE